MTNRADNFNRSNGAIGTPSDGGSAWSAQSGTWNVTSNQAQETTGGSQTSVVLESSVSNVEVQATASDAGADSGLILRAADDSNYILGTFSDSGNTMSLFKRVAGSFTQLGSTFSGAVADGDVFLLSGDSSNALAWKQNGTSRVTATDSAGSTNTKHGMRCHADSTNRFDDFSITEIGGGGVIGSLIGGKLLRRGVLLGGRLV